MNEDIPGRSRSSSSAQRRIVAVAGVVLLAACGDRQTIVGTRLPSPEAAVVAASVTGRAAEALGDDGKFNLQFAQNGPKEVNQDQAVKLAELWGHQFAALLRTRLTAERGATIDYKNLSSCGRPLYAESPFEPPPEDWPAPYRAQFGPYWLITLCARGVPQLSVAVSAWATELKIENGRIVFPFNSGNEFVGIGIPTNHVGEFPSPPEAALVIALQRTGRRVQNIPTLTMADARDGVPQIARWKFDLDGDTPVRTREGTRQEHSLFVGATSEMRNDRVARWVPSADQPTSVQTIMPIVGQPGETPAQSIARQSRSPIVGTVKVRSASPLRFVMVQEGN